LGKKNYLATLAAFGGKEEEGEKRERGLSQ